MHAFTGHRGATGKRWWNCGERHDAGSEIIKVQAQARETY